MDSFNYEAMRLDYEPISFDSSKEFDSFRMNISEISKEFKELSTITKKDINSFTKLSTFKKISKAMKSKKIPYPDREEIPLIRVKNKNLFESGERIKIKKYIKNLIEFDDSKFNKCNICKKASNNYFCKKCYKNICDICQKNCVEKKHELINLFEELNKIIEYKTKIRLMFAEWFILPKKEKENNEIIKETKNYSFVNEYEMNNEIEEKPMDYTYDIILIEAIIEKNYINYFHYKNIEECYNYVAKKNSINFINDKLNIQSDSENNIINIEEDSEDDIDYIIIKYKLRNGKENIKVFGHEFSKKYKNICKIIYENKIYELTEFFKFKNTKENNIIEIKLKGINNINDTSNMFDCCSSLISLPDISKWNTNNVSDMSYMFDCCSSLISLPDISKWNTNNVTNMRYMFSHCSSLISLPNISKWNMKKVKDIYYIFEECPKLISFPYWYEKD